MNEPLVLAVGASGRFAGLVVPELAKRGLRVRGLVRQADMATEVRARGAVEVVSGDLRDSASLDAALRGVWGVFHIGPGLTADESQMGLNMIAAARRAGVRRFVYSSAIHPGMNLDHHQAKLPVEAALYESGMEFVVLQPATFFQAAPWASIFIRGIVADPFSSQSQMSRVDYRDVAEAAALALSGNELNYGTYELCGETASAEDVARIASAVLGRKITSARLSFEEWKALAHAPVEKEPLFRRMFEHYNDYGMRGNTLVLRSILKREPRTIRQYIEELAAGSK